MKFTNSPFAILDKNMNALDYQKRNLKYKDYWRREGVSWDEFTRHSQTLADTNIFVNRSNFPNTSPNISPTLLEKKGLTLSEFTWNNETLFLRRKHNNYFIATIYKDFDSNRMSLTLSDTKKIRRGWDSNPRIVSH